MAPNGKQTMSSVSGAHAVFRKPSVDEKKGTHKRHETEML